MPLACSGSSVHNNAVMHASHSRNFAFFECLFSEVRPSLEKTLLRYEVPPSEVYELLEETVLEFIYKGEAAGDPARWLVSNLRNRCRRYWVSQRREFFRALEGNLDDRPALTEPRS